MANLKFIIHLLDVTFSGLWALVMVDLLPFIGSIPLLTSIDEWIKIAMGIAGFVYFIVRIFFFAQHQVVELKIKKEELEKLKNENAES